jgi:hypothetical protein
MTLTGRPIGTIIRGRRVMWEAALLDRPIGRPIRFDATIAPRSRRRSGRSPQKGSTFAFSLNFI